MPCRLIIWVLHKLKVKVKLLSCIGLFVTPWTVAYHTPLSMGFSRQEYCSGLPFTAFLNPIWILQSHSFLYGSNCWREFVNTNYVLEHILILDTQQLSCFSHAWLFCDPMDCSPPGFSVHEISQTGIWNRLLFPSPGDLPNPGIEPVSLALLHWQVSSLPLRHQGSPILHRITPNMACKSCNIVGEIGGLGITGS